LKSRKQTIPHYFPYAECSAPISNRAERLRDSSPERKTKSQYQRNARISELQKRMPWTVRVNHAPLEKQSTPLEYDESRKTRRFWRSVGDRSREAHLPHRHNPSRAEAQFRFSRNIRWEIMRDARSTPPLCFDARFEICMQSR
jgi:hypothetical protein